MDCSLSYGRVVLHAEDKHGICTVLRAAFGSQAVFPNHHIRNLFHVFAVGGCTAGEEILVLNGLQLKHIRVIAYKYAHADDAAVVADLKSDRHGVSGITRPAVQRKHRRFTRNDRHAEGRRQTVVDCGDRLSACRFERRRRAGIACGHIVGVAARIRICQHKTGRVERFAHCVGRLCRLGLDGERGIKQRVDRHVKRRLRAAVADCDRLCTDCIQHCRRTGIPVRNVSGNAVIVGICHDKSRRIQRIAHPVGREIGQRLDCERRLKQRIDRHVERRRRAAVANGDRLRTGGVQRRRRAGIAICDRRRRAVRVGVSQHKAGRVERIAHPIGRLGRRCCHNKRRRKQRIDRNVKGRGRAAVTDGDRLRACRQCRRRTGIARRHICRFAIRVGIGQHKTVCLERVALPVRRLGRQGLDRERRVEQRIDRHVERRRRAAAADGNRLRTDCIQLSRRVGIAFRNVGRCAVAVRIGQHESRRIKRLADPVRRLGRQGLDRERRIKQRVDHHIELRRQAVIADGDLLRTNFVQRHRCAGVALCDFG